MYDDIGEVFLRARGGGCEEKREIMETKGVFLIFHALKGSSPISAVWTLIKAC